MCATALLINILTYHFCMFLFASVDSGYYLEKFLLTIQTFTHISPCEITCKFIKFLCYSSNNTEFYTTPFKNQLREGRGNMYIPCPL